MADIFAGTTPPAWLTDMTRQVPGELGQIGGLALGGLLNALQEAPTKAVPVKDEKTGEVTMKPVPQDSGVSGWFSSRKGFAEGLAEARLNIEDPMWRTKAAQAQANLLQTMAQTQAQYGLAQERKAETAAWMQDAPQLSKWLTATPEQRQDMPTPTAVSKQGLAAIEKSRDADARYFIQKDANDIKKQSAENQTAAAKAAATNTKSFYDMLKTVTDPQAQADILAKTKNGLPTPEAWAALTAAPRQTAEQEKQAGREKLEGIKQSGRATLEEQKQEGRESLADINAKNKAKFETERQENRLELKKLEGDLKIDLEKMKLGAKDNKGRVVSEDEYVNRHFNTLFNAAWKEAEVKDIRVITKNVESALRLRYRTEHKEAPKPATAAPTAAGPKQTTEMPSTAATTNAPSQTAPMTPPAKPAGTNDISYDDFQNWLKGK
jgi:hypothetical protein